MSYDKAAYEAYLNSDNRTQASKNVITITNGMSLKGDSEKEGKLKLTATGDGILNVDGVGTISLPTGDVVNTGDAGDIRYNNTDDIFQGKKSNGEWQTFGAGSNLWQESTNSAIYYNAGKISIGSSTEPAEKLEVKDGKIKTYGADSGFIGNLDGNVTGDVTGTVSSISNHTTDNLSEGSNNLYFTDTRARSSISINKLGGLGSLDYNIPAGIIDYTGPTETEIRSTLSAGTGVTLTDGEIAIGQSVSQSDDVSFNKLILTSDLSGVDASFNNAFIGSLTSDSITVTNLNLGGADLQTTLNTKQDKLTDGLLAGNNVIMDPASANDGDIARFKPDGLFGVSIGDLSTELGISSKQDTITSSTNLTINDISANDASFNNVKATKFIGNLTGTVSGDVTGNSGTVSIISNHSIDGLSDIDTTGKINGSVLKYNSTSTKWEVGTDISGSSSGIALTDLSVTTATASSTPALSYDNQNGQFTYTPPSIPDITTKQNAITSSTDLVLNDISANDISANNINANDISANDISANDISANDISANNITANDISANDASFNNVKATKFIGDLSGNINGSSATVTSISTHSISNLSDISLNSSELFDGGVLKYNATSQLWKIAVDSLSSDGSGIALTSLSVQQAASSSTPSLTYNNQNGVFTYTPPSIPDITTKQNTLTTSTNITVNDISANDISANDISANDISANDVSFNNVKANQISAFRMNGHIIPTSNANFDLGNAEYKIRHLFLSDNSLWIGDDHKIDISGGELRFKKRNKKRVPKAIIDSGIDVNTAINGVETLVGKSGIENFTLDDWYKWARQSNDFINNAAGGNGDVNNVTIDKIFQDDSNFIASGNDNKKNLNRLRNRVITVSVKSKQAIIHTMVKDLDKRTILMTLKVLLWNLFRV